MTETPLASPELPENRDVGAVPGLVGLDSRVQSGISDGNSEWAFPFTVNHGPCGHPPTVNQPGSVVRILGKASFANDLKAPAADVPCAWQ